MRATARSAHQDLQPDHHDHYDGDEPDIPSLIATARSEAAPTDWWIWPLQRDYVSRSAFNSGALGLIGLVLLIPAFFVMVPADFSGALFRPILASLILVILGVVAFGGVGIAIYDAWRLLRADDFLLIMTPDEFVKVEPGQVTHVPMSAIARVTVKGVKSPERGPSNDELRSRMSQGSSRTYGDIRGNLPFTFNFGTLENLIARKNARGPRSLAFLDLRTRSEVLICTDESFGGLYDLQAALNRYAKGVDLAL
ncbi:MAG TPA: hypothetical protein VKQ36_06535 [Ktedonobacterales bacterium]|nr:hypothetical protein [Ktedonobacterales bacterium]